MARLRILVGLTNTVKDAREVCLKKVMEPIVPTVPFMASLAVTMSDSVSVELDGKTPFENSRKQIQNGKLEKFRREIFFQPTAKCNQSTVLDVR